jgi:hypothetical protein
MVVRRGSESKSEKDGRRPATTPEARENQLVALAVDLAEKQLKEGSASAQVISHYLKLGSTREQLEQERIRYENELLQIKTEVIASQQKVEQLYLDALNAMRSYSGEAPKEKDDEYDD